MCLSEHGTTNSSKESGLWLKIPEKARVVPSDDRKYFRKLQSQAQGSGESQALPWVLCYDVNQTDKVNALKRAYKFNRENRPTQGTKQVIRT